ncbi:MAG TPA: ankyrin repeat domain-containing protein [Blastocatellia bacterium]|nr:ankyrin repeat domain-containing protein [Blastocatellia bacterium]
MSDALPLPPRPNLEQYKKRAKDLMKICKSGDQAALRAWVTEWIEALVRLHDLDITLPRNGHRAYTPAEIGYRIERTVDRITKHLNAADRPLPTACTLARAQFAIAREHGFASWPRFASHLKGLARSQSSVAVFEAAVDAIVNGDLATLEKLLSRNPELARTRSTREHRSTLLHYVSANGVEDFRQKTPKNIVEIAKLLLKAGADVNAESDAYGGRSTTLGLTATSCHPETAGVQIQLMDLLIEYGAKIDGPDGGSAVNGCLHNGRGEAAEYFASRGARLDLEGAAGVGRLNAVKSFFNDDGSLKPPVTRQQMMDGFARACAFGRISVIDFLLQTGMEVDAKLRHEGQTGLHWAAYGGHVEAVKLLLERGAPVDVKDDSHGGTPLDWALYAWGSREVERGSYYEVIALLARAGARLDPQWYADDEDRRRAATKMRSDPRMLAALAGNFPPLKGEA